MMRLTGQQRRIIRTTVAKTFGAGVRGWLFGSRADDSKRGGDIGLLIETDQRDVDALFRSEIEGLGSIQMKPGKQKVDVLLDTPSFVRKIHCMATALSRCE
jgi:hypothetical protein